jgi:hypothetical protein
MNITRKIRLALAGLALAASAATVTSSGTVSASPWDPHVAVTGRATCSPMLGSKITWMWFEASNGERGWAQLLDSPSLTRRYRFDLYKVPSGSAVTVTVKWGCSNGEAYAKPKISRPRVGTYTTVNLCPQWWTGACLI